MNARSELLPWIFVEDFLVVICGEGRSASPSGV